MATSPVPEGRFWAKLSRAGQQWHPLSAHLADVAAVLERLLLPRGSYDDRLARSLGLTHLPDSHRQALVFLAAIHDLGKVNHGFQSKGPGGAGGDWPRRGHVRVLLESLRVPVVKAAALDILNRLPVEDLGAREDLLRTTIAHHGRPWDVTYPLGLERLWLPAQGRDPVAEMERLIHLASQCSGLGEIEVREQLTPTPEFTHLFAGLLTLADWIGSTVAAFPFEPAADDDPEAYWSEAQRKAERACRLIGALPHTPVNPSEGQDLLAQLFPGVFPKYQPTRLQAAIATQELPPAGSRVLIESETGSGKTEAALSLYARLRASGAVSGLLFALPTRATSRAMLDRVSSALPGMYEGPPPTMALAVGGQQPGVQSSNDLLSASPHLYPDRQDRELIQWSTSSAKKFFAAEIVVGTIDQILLAGLPVRHAHLRLAGLSRHLLVIDEIHSYDRYMASVLANLIDLFTAVGGIVVFMSATLSGVERQRYGNDKGELPPLAVTTQTPYPVLSVCASMGSSWHDQPLTNPNPRSKEVEWSQILATEAADLAADAANQGARVCIMRNTVAAARDTVSLLGRGAPALLWRPQGSKTSPAYHSRYIRGDRDLLDREVITTFGRSGAGAGVILVATQVVEQSLDVDFDLLITDLCPIDVLLQRIGRLHRHPERHRPNGCETARCAVIRPPAGIRAYLERRRGPNGWGTVYEDLADLELTSRLLQELPSIEIPAQNRELIERVYHPSRRHTLTRDSDWGEYLDHADNRAYGQEILGGQVSLRFDRTYHGVAQQFDIAQEEAIRTRLGDDSVRVELAEPAVGIYAPDRSAQSIDLPFRVLRRAKLDPSDLPRAEQITRRPDERVYQLGEVVFAYGVQGWTW